MVKLTFRNVGEVIKRQFLQARKPAPVITTALEGIKRIPQAIQSPTAQRVGGAITKYGFGVSPEQKVYGAAIPIGVGGAGAVAKGVYSGAKEFITRATANPFVGQTFKQAISGAAARGAGVAGTIIGAGAIYSAASGTEYNFPDVRNLSLAALGGALTTTPVAVASALFGTAKKAELKISDIATNYLPPSIPSLPIPQIPTFPESPLNFIFEGGFPSATGSIVAIPPSPSVDVNMPSSSMGDLLPLLLLLAGGGLGAGYLLGKRKKKKKRKKYKRGKRR